MPKIDMKEAERLRKKGGQLIKDRDSNWLAKWKDQRDFLSPAEGQFDGDIHNDGRRRDQKINNAKPVRSAQIMAAGMASGMASLSREWFVLQPPTGVAQTAAVKTWLYQVQLSMRAVLAKSNLYTVLPQLFLSEGVYGTGVMAALPDPFDVVRFSHYPTGTYAIDLSARGVVDTFYREFKMTPRQMAQQFGLDNLSPTIKQAAERGELTPVDVCHLIEPNPDADMSKVDNRSMPWKSSYWEKGCTTDYVLRVSGFKSFPIMAPRWDVNGTNVYGTGPGDIAVGKSKELQLLEADKLRIVQQIARPATAMPISMRGQAHSMVPGGVTWLPDNLVGSAVARPMYEPNPASLAAVGNEIMTCERAISEAFFEDLFLLITQSEGSMTAYEVAQRKEEKMLMLGPVVDRNNDELFDPLMDQVFSIMYEQSLPRWMGLLPGEPLIPPPPEEMQGIQLSIEYVSILAQAQKALAVSGIERALQFTGLLVQSGVQDAYDMIDTDVAQTAYYDAVGAPPTMIRGPEQVAAIRQARVAQAQQQQEMEQGAALLEGVKTLAETPTGGDTALNAITGAMQ